MLVAMEEPDLKRHALTRERPRQPSGLDHDAIIDHGGDRMRGMFVAKKLSGLSTIGEAQPCARQITALALDQSKIAM